MALLVPFMGLGPVSRWKRDRASAGALSWLSRHVAVLCGLTLPLLQADYNVWVALAVLLSAWLVLGLFKDLWFRVRGASSVGRGLRRLTPSYWGMFMAHLGFAACIIGVVAPVSTTSSTT